MSRSKTPAINRLEYLLKVTGDMPIDELSWHAQAATTLTERPDSARQFLRAGQQILSEFSVNKLAGYLAGEAPHKKTLAKLRDQRKLLMIARDTLMLCAADASFPETDDLFALTRHLGLLADSGGQDRKALNRSRKNAKHLRPIAGLPFEPVTDDVFRERIHERILSPYLVDEEPCTVDVFHDSRKEFRRVAHLSLTACVASPSVSGIAFAVAGRELSSQYGDDQMRLFGDAVSDR